MESKYTTITISKELSKRIRQYALDNGLRTGETIKIAIDRLYAEDLVTLFGEIDRDLGNAPRTYNLEPTKEKNPPVDFDDSIEGRSKHVTKMIKNKK
jgi:hypothetical protein